jgi:D-inositol-3-phosphate glycosyltransferase
MLSYHTCPLATLGGKDTGGMNVYVRELTRKLGSIGVHVDVYTRSQDEHVPHVVHDLGFGNRVVHVPAGPELPLQKQELVDHIPSFVEYILNFTERKNLEYDVIHSHYWMSGIAGRDLKGVWNVPMVHMFHTLGLMKNRIARTGELEGDYRIRGEREVLRSADKIIAATPAELAQLQWLYEVKTDFITIVPPGVNLGRFYPIPKDEAKEYLNFPLSTRMILFVGRIEPLKGIDTLINAVACMRDEGALNRHDIRLSIIGGDASVSEDEMDHEMARLHQLRRDLGLDDFITFLGKRSQDSLQYYYSAADVVVVPSHYESFGMVALEAMACGTPVVASQVGGLAYLIRDGETGYHVPDQDPFALCAPLITLLDDEELHTHMSLQAAEDARGYAWEVIAERVLEIYKGVYRD